LKKPKTKRVTLADVAAKAGVSVATASVAITGRPSGNCRVSPAVAEKIRRAARALNYRPNLQARNLSTQRTHTVALLVKRSAWHNAMYYVSSNQRILRERGFSEVFLLHPDDSVESELENLELCISRNVEGIILIPLIDLKGRSNRDRLNEIHQKEGIPLVQLGLHLPGCESPYVTTDDVTAVRQTVTLLHSMGHRRIAHATVKGHESESILNPFLQSHDRYVGYMRGMADLGLEPQVFASKEAVTDVNKLYAVGLETADQIARTSPRPTAVIAFGDFVAIGLLARLSELGINVPGEISVLGIGNLHFGEMVRPTLSTLAPPYDQMGQRATETLLDLIEGREGKSLSLPPKLIMRQSVRSLNGS
jgi:LacI family transcriptional regulator